MKQLKCIFAAILCGVLILVMCSGCEGTSTSSEPKVETVENVEMTLEIKCWNYEDGKTIDTLTRTGTYTGEIVDGLPDGWGRFDTTGVSGPYYYEGEFSDGDFDGQGKCVWENGHIEEGTYKNDLFSPTPAEFYKTISNNFNSPSFSLPTISANVIKDESKFFPCSEAIISDELMAKVDPNLTYSSFSRNPMEHCDSYMYVPTVTVFDISEMSGWGIKLYEISCFDSSAEDVYYIFYTGENGSSIDEGDIVDIVGLPVCMSGYDNVSGGYTNCVIIIGCVVV